MEVIPKLLGILQKWLVVIEQNALNPKKFGSFEEWFHNMTTYPDLWQMFIVNLGAHSSAPLNE